MLERKQPGFVELIPSPKEKRAEVVQTHSLGLLAVLHTRLSRIEHAMNLPDDLAARFDEQFARIEKEEAEAIRAYNAASSAADT